MTVDLRVRLGGLRLANPVLVAAGTFGYGLEFSHAVRLDEIGALVTKTVTLKPREGNPPPRLIETASGMLNSVGLQNVGLDAFLSEKLPKLAALPVPVIVSVLGDTLGEIQELCGRLDKEATVAAIEINLSCPNEMRRHDPTNKWRIDMVAQEAGATRDMVEAARRATGKPLIAKLTPDVTDIRPIAQAAEAAGADALTLCNTFTGMSLDPRTRRSRLGALTGGVSGPAIKPLSLYRVWLAHQAVRCPVIGLGGILNEEDALEFFLAGASAVALGTANFRDPAAAVKLVRRLRRRLERDGVASVSELIGGVQADAVSA